MTEWLSTAQHSISFIQWWKFRLFPCVGCCKWCCYDLWVACIFLNDSFAQVQEWDLSQTSLKRCLSPSLAIYSAVHSNHAVLSTLLQLLSLWRLSKPVGWMECGKPVNIWSRDSMWPFAAFISPAWASFITCWPFCLHFSLYPHCTRPSPAKSPSASLTQHI